MDVPLRVRVQIAQLVSKLSALSFSSGLALGLDEKAGYAELLKQAEFRLSSLSGLSGREAEEFRETLRRLCALLKEALEQNPSF